MNTSTLIPLIAALAYIPLLVILLSNEPRQRQQKFFLLFLIAALLWSISEIFARSYFFLQSKLLLSQIVMFIGLWMMVQYHYFLRSLYETRRLKVPLLYGVLAAFIALAMLGYIPRSIDFTISGINVEYGNWIIPIFAILLIVIVRDIRCLWRKRQVSTDVAGRSQISYLFLGLAALAGFGIATVAVPFGGSYPLAHIGNIAMACILSYAVITHHLLDIRIVSRQSLIYLHLYAISLVTGSLLFLLAHLFFGFEPDWSTLAVTIGIWIPVILFLFTRQALSGKNIRDVQSCSKGGIRI